MVGRPKKIKTEQELIKYEKRRREQNRINQQNFRDRKNRLKKIQEIPFFKENKKYREELKIFLKQHGYNYFLTLTTQKERNLKYLKSLSNRFFNKLGLEIGFDRVFCVIETKNKPHIHILIKTDNTMTSLVNFVSKNWFEGNVKNIQKIYSGEDNYKLESYLLKEVFYNSQEVNWVII